MLGSTIGAQAASPRSRTTGHRSVGLAIGVALLGVLAAAPVASASIAVRTPDATTPVALTTTAVDKPWYTVERFYLGLVNCTRTGGWVLSDGTCRGYGSGRYSAYVAPLTYSYGLSDKVSRPYAKLIAVRNLCSHFVNGDPGYRLRRVGYTRYTWGENIGCRDGYASAKAAVLASHLYFQAEKSSGGGHWKNIKNARYRSLGVGIWRYGTRTRLVTDFYG
ncbi:MAG TPA: CAP domain-containing protein [Methylomirabilota bacterium]|nr:CAP domain-containing protein [Methylomirabilota bacterium]